MSTKRQILLIALLCFLNFFINNGFLFPDIMEARNLITAREMVEFGNWMSPTMNEYPRLAKPPLPTWINGLIALFVPVSKLAIHRIPAALTGMMLVFFIFFLSRRILNDPLSPFIASCVAATSFYIVFMSRQATWDIYCHTFMTGAIWMFVTAWQSKKNTYRYHILAGILMGLSFLSKGPVAFFALLLPFLISWPIFMDRKVFGQNWKPLLLSVFITIVISMSWPTYILLTNADDLIHTMNTESQSWSNRHVRPFYRYWSFPAQMGIWTGITAVALFFPWVRKKIRDNNYKFLVGWVFFAVILLSIPPEKKEKYLLPVLVPMSILTAQYLTYLYRTWQAKKLEKVEVYIIRVLSILFMIVCLVVPAILFVVGSKSFLFVISLIIYLAILVNYGFAIKKFNLRIMFFCILAEMTTISIVGLPQAHYIFYKNKDYTSLRELKEKSYYKHKFYGIDMNPKQIWELEKSVDTLRVNIDSMYITPSEEQFVIMINEKADKRNFDRNITRIQFLDSIHFDPKKPARTFYLYLVNQENKETDLDESS